MLRGTRNCINVPENPSGDLQGCHFLHLETSPKYNQPEDEIEGPISGNFNLVYFKQSKKEGKTKKKMLLKH